MDVRPNTTTKMHHRALGFLAGLGSEIIEFMMVSLKHTGCQTYGGDCRADLSAGLEVRRHPVSLPATR
jgi:hypothetical protein